MATTLKSAAELLANDIRHLTAQIPRQASRSYSRLVYMARQDAEQKEKALRVQKSRRDLATLRAGICPLVLRALRGESDAQK